MVFYLLIVLVPIAFATWIAHLLLARYIRSQMGSTWMTTQGIRQKLRRVGVRCTAGNIKICLSFMRHVEEDSVGGRYRLTLKGNALKTSQLIKG